MIELRVNRQNLRETEISELPRPDLQPGEILVAIVRFALTANNITYAATGDFIGYWRFFPAPDPWGKVPVWGFARVEESTVPEVRVGEMLYGFFPMATHLVMRPGAITQAEFQDVAPHRAVLPALYNYYQRTAADPPFLKGMEDVRCLLFPLFCTSFILFDYLTDNGYFGAQQLVVTSASSKTGFGLTELVGEAPMPKPRVFGLTSPGNLEFVTSLGVCDVVLSYAASTQIPGDQKTLLVDMSGDGKIIAGLHEHLGENMVASVIVGATHWEAGRHQGTLPGAKPTLFFAPAQMAKCDQDWGAGEMIRRAYEASAAIAKRTRHALSITHEAGPQMVRAAYLKMLNGKVPPETGVILSMHDDGFV